MEGVTSVNTTPEEEMTPEIEAPEAALATIGALYSDGVSLIFDGEEEATEKHYKVNTSIEFSAGDRVKVSKISGTYIVEYIVGAPMRDYALPKGGVDGDMLVKSGATDYAAAWKTIDIPEEHIPKGGSDGQMLAKDGDLTDYKLKWVDGNIPASSKAGDVLTSTSTGTEWATPHYIPSGGTNGQILAKTANTDYSAGWRDSPVPSGGSDGQVLTKDGSTNYKTKWGSITGTLPKGGSAGEFLKKSGSADYATEWGEPSVSKLTAGSGYYAMSAALDSSGNFTPGKNSGYSLGTSSYPWANLYVTNPQLGGSSGKVGFFGTTPISQITLSAYSSQGYSGATTSNYLSILNNLCGILSKYGLIKT